MKKKIILIIILIIIGLTIGGYLYFGIKTGKIKSWLDRAVGAGSLPEINPLSNPLEDMPEINPVDKINPFKNLKLNPFK